MRMHCLGMTTNKRAKLGSKAIKSAFIDYSLHNKAYRFLDLKTFSVLEAIHPTYFEYLTT